MHFTLALLVLVIEAALGYPDAFFQRIGHPVTWLGALISFLDARYNRDARPFARRRDAGVMALSRVVAIALAAAFALQALTARLPFGELIAALLASTLLAQRSLYTHVADVARALNVSLVEGRAAVAKIVGRDVSSLDEAGVARAAIESLAENFSDGVVAPALWLAVFGLPGALVYKAVNTADSMIGHKTPRHLAFGWAAARCDDLMNFIPARVSAGLLAAAASTLAGASPQAALATARRDAGKHASPNAGWPESAMAGALGYSLSGPRIYQGAPLDAPTLGDGKRDLGPADIDRALALYRRAAAALWLLIGAGAIILH